MSFYRPFLLDVLPSLGNPVASSAINMKIGKSMKIFTGEIRSTAL
jgi:hypothetical protein